MRRIGITFSLAVVASVTLYLIADLWLDIGAEHAKAIAGIPLLFSTQIFRGR